MRLIVANLDCEAAFAEAAGVTRHHPTLAVARRISALGTLMAAFGRPGDALWTPLPVDPARIAWPAGVSLHSGALARLRVPEAILAWGETREVARRRAASARHARIAPPASHALGLPAAREPGAPAGDPLAWLWSLPADAEAAWRCNDRRFCVPVQEALGCRVPGAALIGSLDELRAHLAAFAGDRDIELGPDHAWVLKAPFSASGRLRVRCSGRDLDTGIATRIERLLARFGPLCFEPWMERIVDFGCLGAVTGADAWSILPPHRLETDHAGVFRGIVVDPDASWLAPGEREAVTRAATEAARALARAGYRGPFGVDGFAYRRAGARALQPICEINARLSFGFVAHALAQRLGRASLRLGVGAAIPPPAAGQDARILPLLHPGGEDGVCAWAAWA